MVKRLVKMWEAQTSVQVLQARIEAADPRRILERGYALAVDGDGVVLKSASGCAPGDKVSVMFSDGTLECSVNKVAVEYN